MAGSMGAEGSRTAKSDPTGGVRKGFQRMEVVRRRKGVSRLAPHTMDGRQSIASLQSTEQSELPRSSGAPSSRTTRSECPVYSWWRAVGRTDRNRAGRGRHRCRCYRAWRVPWVEISQIRFRHGPLVAPAMHWHEPVVEGHGGRGPGSWGPVSSLLERVRLGLRRVGSYGDCSRELVVADGAAGASAVDDARRPPPF